MAVKTATIPWAPFSGKHKRYIRACMRQTINVAEGAVRSGKTIDHCIVAAAYLETCQDKIHLASGSSVANAKLNIGDCNGFGLEYLFRGRCSWSKYKGNDALLVETQTGQKVVVFAGAAKANSFQKILGNSYGLWIATEINQHHQTFIQTAFDRQLAAVERKVLWDLNPGSPTNWIYTDYIDLYREKGIANYQHFTLLDNRSISDERKAEIERQYDPKSVWYRRNIKGERCIAEGLVYPQFADNTEAFIVEEPPKDVLFVTIGIDFGGNGSAHAFVANAITARMAQVVTVAEYYRKEVITPTQLSQDFSKFITKVKTIYPGQRQFVAYADSEATVLIEGLRTAAAQEGLPVDIRLALKGPITNRIDFYNSIMAQGRYKVCRSCPRLIEAFCNAGWDPKKPTEDERLDDGSTNIDSLDAVEYSTEPYMRDVQQVLLLQTPRADRAIRRDGT